MNQSRELILKRRKRRELEVFKKVMEPVIKLTRVNTYKCKTCTEIFLSEDKLEKHSKIHTHQSVKYSLPGTTAFTLSKDCELSFPPNRECVLEEISLNILREEENNEETLFKCEYCSLQFHSESTYEAHWLNHQQFPHACHCGNVYHLLTYLQTHVSLAHPVKQGKSWAADTSNVESYTISEFSNNQLENKLKSHIEDVFEDNTIKAKNTKSHVDQKLTTVAKEANQKRENNISKENRMKNADLLMAVNDDGSFYCLTCGIKFNAKGTYRRHYYKCHERKFVCPKCGKSFGVKSSLQIHMVTHLDKSDWPYSCSICNKRFTQVGSVKIHYKRVHARIKDIICQYCKKAFSDRANFVNHERIHTGIKPYKCKYCGKRFSDPSAFQRHIRTHTGDKIYACPECPMRFSDASGLIAHKLRHAGIKKHKCDICDKAFLQANVLKTHVERVHIGLRKFECHYCGKKCCSKYNVQNHIQSVHGKEFGKLLPKPKLFECAHCGKKTTAKNNLKSHILNLHKTCLGLKK